jgi:hypothetical protein
MCDRRTDECEGESDDREDGAQDIDGFFHVSMCVFGLSAAWHRGYISNLCARTTATL